MKSKGGFRRGFSALSAVGLIVCLLFSVNTFAAESAKETISATNQEKRAYLASIGAPEEFLATMSDERVAQQYDLVYGKNMKFTVYETKVLPVDEDGIPKGTIPPGELQLTLGIYGSEDTSQISAMIVSADYKWLKAPYFKMTDALAFQFDGTKLMIGGIYSESGYHLPDGTYYESDYVDAPADAGDGYLGWYLRLVIPATTPTDGLNFGGADIQLLPRNDVASKSELSSRMYFKYAHSILTSDIGFAISNSGAGATIAFTGTHDEQSVAVNY